MNDWDGLAGDQDGNADAASSPNAKKEEEKKVVPLPAVAAKNNNKTMYLAMGGLMLFVMGVFGYTKYMQIQNMQNEERQQQQQAFKNQKQEAERKKNEAEAKDKAAVVATAEKPAVESAPASASQPQNEDLVALAQLKNRNNPNAATPAAAPVVIPPAAMPVPARPVVAQTAPVAQSYAPAQDAQKREQYVSMLEGRVNDLGLTKLRLEAELCKYEPRRAFCGTSNKPAAAQESQREPAQANARPTQQVQQASGRVMLFDTAKAGNAITPELSRTASKTNGAQTLNLPSRAQTADAAPKALSLQGLTILRDRVLYRDRDGLTHEVELGGTMEGLGRLERIDFERKSFQAGGRTYN